MKQEPVPVFLGNEADEEDATENGRERWLLDGGTIENSDEE